MRRADAARRLYRGSAALAAICMQRWHACAFGGAAPQSQQVPAGAAASPTWLPYPRCAHSTVGGAGGEGARPSRRPDDCRCGDGNCQDKGCQDSSCIFDTCYWREWSGEHRPRGLRCIVWPPVLAQALGTAGAVTLPFACHDTLAATPTCRHRHWLPRRQWRQRRCARAREHVECGSTLALPCAAMQPAPPRTRAHHAGTAAPPHARRSTPAPPAAGRAGRNGNGGNGGLIKARTYQIQGSSGFQTQADSGNGATRTFLAVGGGGGGGGLGSCPSRNVGCVDNTCTSCGAVSDYRVAKYGPQGPPGKSGAVGRRVPEGTDGARGVIDGIRALRARRARVRHAHAHAYAACGLGVRRAVQGPCTR